MATKFFIDSNIWIYLFAGEDKRKCSAVKHFIEECSVNGVVFIVSYQVINEVSTVLKKQYFAETEIRFIIETMLEICIVQDFSKDLLLSASVLREKYSFSFWDSLIIASAIYSGCSKLISEDMQNGQKIGEVIINNIFDVV